MAEKQPQTLKNHGKFVAGYHFFVVPILTINVLWSAWSLVSSFSPQNVLNLLIATALFMVAFYARIFPLKAQDRVIRSEELRRIDAILSDEGKKGVEGIRPSLFVALRFASDEELESLVKRVAGGELKEKKSIKQAIKTWRPDTFRL